MVCNPQLVIEPQEILGPQEQGGAVVARVESKNVLLHHGFVQVERYRTVVGVNHSEGRDDSRLQPEGFSQQLAGSERQAAFPDFVCKALQVNLFILVRN